MPIGFTKSTQPTNAAKPYDIIQFDFAGHTLELEGGHSVRSLVEHRLPMIRRVFAWLEDHAEPAD